MSGEWRVVSKEAGGPGVRDHNTSATRYSPLATRHSGAIRIAHFVQRYPPALGGSEAYFARLGRYLAAQGDCVTVFTTEALDLEAFWSPHARRLPAGVTDDDGIEVRRYPLWHCPGRRYLLKALSLLPWRGLQRLALGCNPICWAMLRDARR